MPHVNLHLRVHCVMVKSARTQCVGLRFMIRAAGLLAPLSETHLVKSRPEAADGRYLSIAPPSLLGDEAALKEPGRHQVPRGLAAAAVSRGRERVFRLLHRSNLDFLDFFGTAFGLKATSVVTDCCPFAAFGTRVHRS